MFHEVTIVSMHIYSKHGGNGVCYMLVTTKEAASCQNTADHQQRFCCYGNHNSHIQISTQVMGKINKEVSCKKWISTCTMHIHILCMHSLVYMYTHQHRVILHIEMVSINNCRYTQCKNYDMFTACRL